MGKPRLTDEVRKKCRHDGCGGQVFSSRGKFKLRLCVKHFRFRRMQDTAKSVAKKVPTVDELESLLASVSDMVCPLCKRQMIWTSDGGLAGGRDMVMSLQHYRDGSLGLICFSCNARHGSMPGDSFCELPDGHKLCRGCNVIKPHGEFGRSRRYRLGINTYCRKCHTTNSLATYYRKKQIKAGQENTTSPLNAP